MYVDAQGKEMTPEEFSRLMHAHGVNRQQLHSRLEPFVRQSFKVGKLNLVDLAGSERVRLSGATGQRPGCAPREQDDCQEQERSRVAQGFEGGGHAEGRIHRPAQRRSGGGRQHERIRGWFRRRGC